MTTDKQIAANRLNAQRSTGPKTEAGKQAVRHNAVKHSVLSRNVITTEEEQEEYDGLVRALMEDCHVEGVLEEILVRDIALSTWRRQRAARAETGLAETRIAGSLARLDRERRERFRTLLEELEEGHGTFRINKLRDQGAAVDIHERIHRADIQRQLRDSSLGLHHLTETLDRAIEEVQKGSITDQTARRLALEFSSEIHGPVVTPGAWRISAAQAIERLKAERQVLMDLLPDVEQREWLEVAARRAAAMLPEAEEVNTIHRYETGYANQFHKGLDQLRREQQVRIAAEQKDTERDEDASER